ncbi:hypothetical protein L873DRAFT_1395415 [Choiromyces venosus 120613-1]|uniref:Uncharacterized protein n=1 Tax=Choiromyces venosus 120613-1 TaxID=1336337 RepID=A0A3N4J9C6_9PEZI|nr:hypothetical protein L873DRAFT_1395415 [Choiromyces venosus 120613-1]
MCPGIDHPAYMRCVAPKDPRSVCFIFCSPGKKLNPIRAQPNPTFLCRASFPFPPLIFKSSPVPGFLGLKNKVSFVDAPSFLFFLLACLLACPPPAISFQTLATHLSGTTVRSALVCVVSFLYPILFVRLLAAAALLHKLCACAWVSSSHPTPSCLPTIGWVR